MERLDWRTIEEIHDFKNRTGSVSSTADRSWFQSSSVNWPEKWLNRNQTGWIGELDESVDSLLLNGSIFFFNVKMMSFWFFFELTSITVFFEEEVGVARRRQLGNERSPVIAPARLKNEIIKLLQI